MAANAAYVLAAQGREEHETQRLELLQQIFDPIAHRRLELVEPGWRCLEVAAGRGSIARFLSDRVGPGGQVVATDIDIGYFAGFDRPNGRIIQHNILTDPLATLGGPGTFDLVHARFLLQHLFDDQDLTIARMMELLKPGGWLVIEDLNTDTLAAADPAHPMSARFNQGTAMTLAGLRASRIVDPSAGLALLPRFKRAGLTNLRHEAFPLLEQGGGPLCRWYLQSTEGSRRPEGNPEWEAAVEFTVAALKDPDFWLQSAMLHCAWGQKTEAA
jgi:SAM-dependent methyltransferase